MRHSASETLARDLHDGVEDVGGVLRRTGRRVASDVSATSRSLLARTVAAVKAKPGRALAIGAAAGALLTLALRRRGGR